jgi:hypothetical protein
MSVSCTAVSHQEAKVKSSSLWYTNDFEEQAFCTAEFFTFQEVSITYRVNVNEMTVYLSMPSVTQVQSLLPQTSGSDVFGRNRRALPKVQLPVRLVMRYQTKGTDGRLVASWLEQETHSTVEKTRNDRA